MKSAMHCELLLPAMSAEQAAVAVCPPGLRTLLRFGRPASTFSGSELAWGCQRFGVPHQPDMPVAPYAALGEGLEPGDAYWMHADPVQLLLQRDSFTIHGGAAGGQTLEQAQQMVDALNDYFAAEGLHFFAPHASRWYLRLETPPNLITTPLTAVIGHDIQPYLPRGADELLWHKRLNEIQMLLHGLDVNQGLERQGHAPINSLWLWGGGVLPPVLRPAGIAVWSHDLLLRGLALAHHDAAAPVPHTAHAWLDGAPREGRHLVEFDTPLHAWSQAMATHDRDWIVPLLQALRDGAITDLTLHLAGTRQVKSYILTRTDLRKFWRRAKSFGAYCG